MRILKDHSHGLSSSGTSRFVLPFHACDAYMLTEDITRVVLNLERSIPLRGLVEHRRRGGVAPPEFLSGDLRGGGARMCISNASWGSAAAARCWPGNAL